MPKHIIALILSCLSFTGFSQKTNNLTSRAQNVFLEVGANGLSFSVNYDTRFSSRQSGFGGRAGIGFFGGAEGGILSIPLGLNYLNGKAPNFFEAGIGYTYAEFTGNSGFFSGIGNVIFISGGYRYQSVKNGLIARIVLSPAINLHSKEHPFFYGGIGIGYKF